MKQLDRSWLTMMVVMTLTATAVQLRGHLPDLVPDWLWVLLLLLAAFLKGRLVLLDFLELRATKIWRSAIIASFAAIMSLFLGLAVVPEFQS